MSGGIMKQGSGVVEKAHEFASMAHGKINQRRKGSGEPYIEHPAGVVFLLKSWGVYDEETLAAAWLHDVVEDTESTLEDVRVEFGNSIALIVDGVTNVVPTKINTREWRAEQERNHFSKSCAKAQMVKVADILHNSVNIVDVSPHFAEIWLTEKLLDIEVLTKVPTEVLSLASVSLRSMLEKIRE